MSGVLGVVGGLMKGYGDEKKYRNWNDRQDQTMDIKQAEEDRIKQMHDLQMIYRQNQSSRPELWEDPAKQGPLPQSPNPVAGAIPAGGPPAPPGEAPPGEAGPTASDYAASQPGMGYNRQQETMSLRGSGQAQGPIQTQAPIAPQSVATPGWARAAEGGPVSVPAQALPAGDGYGPPVPPPAAPQEQKSYRERYQEWKKKADADAMMAGGLEGYSKFQDMENATSRRMILGYGLQAIQSLDEGNVGEAMRAGNTALQATPFDTGLKFQAHNGNLVMVGKDGKPGQPLKADHLRAFVEDHMKTPESYLEWKQQYETERAAGVDEALADRKQTEVEREALVTEGISQQNADSNTANAAAYTQTSEVNADEQDTRELLRKAQAYNQLAQGTRALSGGEEGNEGLAWNENNIRDIENMGIAAMNGELGFGKAWTTDIAQDTEAMSSAIGAAKEIRVANNPAVMSDNDAAELARMAYFNEVFASKNGKLPVPPNLLDTTVFDDGEGNFMVRYKGKTLLVPAEVGIRIGKNKKAHTAKTGVVE